MGCSWRAVRRSRKGDRVAARTLLAFAVLAGIALPLAGETIVRVGIYNNPPKVAVDETGDVTGLFPDLIEAIALEESWSLDYVPGTWTESMERLARGEIDLMVDVAFTEPRKVLYAFNEETVLVNWGTVYTRQDRTVLSLPDLEGLRIGVMRGSTHTDDPGGIRDLVERFGIRCEFIEWDSYTDVFATLASGAADAGVVNRVFGLTFEDRYDVKRTPIVFNPIELRFALPLEAALTPALVEGIDRQLAELKADPRSVYYSSLEANLLATPRRETVFRWPAWVLPALASAAVLIVGLVISVLAIRKQIVERTRAEVAARTSEERFELAMRGATDGLWDWNLQTGKVYYSPRWAYMLGYRSEDLEPTIEAFRSLLHPDDRERLLKIESDYVSGRSDRYQAEFRMLGREGFYINILSRAFLVRDAEGVPARVVGTHVDITERKFAEEALREREAYIRTIIENMPVDFFAIDRDMTYTMQSPTSRRAVGDVIGKRADEIDVPESLREHWVSELAQVFAGETVRNEYDMRTTDGKLRTYLSNIAPVVDKGEIIAAIGTSLDITERKKAALELQQAKERAEEADRLKSAFLATMSHELRTPLNSIIGFTGVLLQGLAGPLSEEQEKQLGMVQTSARHLLELINDVLDISKIEAGQLEVHLEPFDLGELLRERTDVARPLADAKGLTFSVDVASDVGSIRSDRRRLGQIVTNLLSNAIKFTEAGAVMTRCHALGDQVVISVEDTGIGISEADLERLFTPFQQVDTGLTRKYEGTGLGLSISKRLIEKLGGAVHVESEPERGSAFTVRIPKDGPDE